MNEYFDIDEVDLVDALDVKLSTEEFTKYDMTEPGVPYFHQR